MPKSAIFRPSIAMRMQLAPPRSADQKLGHESRASIPAEASRTLEATLAQFESKTVAPANPLDGQPESLAISSPDRSAASPTTSGMAPALVVTTGVPQAIASRGGRPKPS